MLLDYSKLENETNLFKAAKHEEKARRFINEEIDQEIGFVLGDLKMGEIIHVANDSRWSLHDLIIHCIKQTGSAAVYFCTYAIKEYQARLLSNMVSNGIITELHALVDYRFKKLDPQAEQLLSQCCKTYRWEERLHGKVCTIQNSEWSIAIVGSANLTTNTSRDTLVLDCSSVAATYWTNWITKNIQHDIKH